MKQHIHFLLFLVACLLTACVYDFRPDYQGQDGYVAIEGDILIGEVCGFQARLSTNLASKENTGDSLSCRFRVEASDGTVYEDSDGIIDLTTADTTLDYRLVTEVTAPFRRTYVSEWAPVEVSPPIDSLSWHITNDGEWLWVNVSTASSDPFGYYRWTVTETWEYYALFYAEYFFAPKGTVYKGQVAHQDTVFTFLDGDNTFYCWNTAERGDIMTGSTADLTEDRLIDYDIYGIHNTDRKLSYVYHTDVRQIRLTEEAFRYWETIKLNSSDVGGLFSPEPVELRGNLVNVDDPDELVLGFICVSRPERSAFFIENSKTHFSRWRISPGDPAYPLPADYNFYYQGRHYRIAFLDPKSEGGPYAWYYGYSCDCLFSGGTKDRPSWWINNDK